MTPERREALLNARAGTDAIRTELSRVLTALTKISPAGCEPLRDLKLKQAAYPGLLLKERYRVERELGRGGFGIVYLARDVQLHSRPVVIKFLRGGPVRDDWFEKKFADEIKALALIDHPGVVGALDAGRTPDGIPYLVMQYVDGVTLRSVTRGGRIPLERTAGIIRQIGHALSAAHDRGVCHRDLKPENIMLQTMPGGEEYVRLIDFGVATIRDPGAQGSGTETIIVGTLSYMAPEQLLGKPCPASDIYAMRVIAYEMFTGALPFEAASVIEPYALQLSGNPGPNDNFLELPEAVRHVILKALSFNPDGRFSRAQRLGDLVARTLARGEVPAEVSRSRLQTRMLDVAMAKQIRVYKPAELVALIRRIESKGLKAILEIDADFSVTEEDVRSKSFQLEFPRDSLGQLQPLELILKVDSPEFEPKTQSKMILVPPEGDSDTYTFLLTPQHLGELRLTLEVCLGNVHIASRILKTHAEASEALSIGAARTLVSIALQVLVDVASVPAAMDIEFFLLESRLQKPETAETSRNEFITGYLDSERTRQIASERARQIASWPPQPKLRRVPNTALYAIFGGLLLIALFLAIFFALK